MGSSLFWSLVAHLVSLHSSYSHRTPCEGARSLSGTIVGYMPSTSKTSDFMGDTDTNEAKRKGTLAMAMAS